MKVIPSIDVEGGVAVKRVRGRRGTGLVLGDPIRLAGMIAGYGFEWVHIVDLEAAGRGAISRGTLSLVRSIARLGLKVQYGGGVGSVEAAAALCASGASRLVIGTGWLRDPSLLAEARTATGCEVLAAVEEDAGGHVLSQGWERRTELTVEEALQAVEGAGASGILYTQTWVEGSLSGPDLARAARVRRLYRGFAVYAGGVSSVRDLEALEAIGFDATVVGMALYTGRIGWREAARYA